jgi:hypothetical protein
MGEFRFFQDLADVSAKVAGQQVEVVVTNYFSGRMHITP